MTFLFFVHYSFAQTNALTSKSIKGPIIKDPNLKVEVVFKGIRFPTSMAFLGPNDILVLEKDKGTVRRIVNGVMLPEPLLDVNVANKIERGMLGIAVSRNLTAKHTRYVFLFFTESKTKDGTDDCPSTVYCKPGNEPLGNNLYRYEFKDNKLINPTLLLNAASKPGPAHNGGAIMLGPDNNLYIPIGDVRGSNPQKEKSPDKRSGILRITQDGKSVGNGILGNKYPLNLYYAYGIRNSFGIDFDPITGNLWDTENGPNYGDEINLVRPGFNSGWNEVQGLARDAPKGPIDLDEDLVNFGGKAKYSDPEFVWANTAGLTAIKFFHSNKLGKQYENDMFVGDFHNGYLYDFDLNKKRTELSLKGGPLADKIANSIEELQDVILGKDFGGITDIEVGPYDGYLYIVSLREGTIYRIVPSAIAVTNNYDFKSCLQ